MHRKLHHLTKLLRQTQKERVVQFFSTKINPNPSNLRYSWGLILEKIEREDEEDLNESFLIWKSKHGLLRKSPSPSFIEEEHVKSWESLIHRKFFKLNVSHAHLLFLCPCCNASLEIHSIEFCQLCVTFESCLVI